MEKEIGKIEKGEYQGTRTDIVVGIKEYNGKLGVDIREFSTGESYTGPTKKGLRIPADKFEDFKQMINSIDSSELKVQEAAPEATTQAPASESSEETNPDENSGVAEDGTM